TVLSDSPSLLQGLFAVAVLFVIQGVISIIRRKVKPLKSLIDNQAIILMAHGEYFSDNLKEANLSTSDVQEVLRKNGLKSKSEVFAVIMETTGDMSVIKNDNTPPDWSLFDDIRD
ncbi:YetF domain-containing protein, partial [Psychrobacter sp. 16-MNA-CIBAN-0192]